MPNVIAVRPPFRKRGQWPLFGMTSVRLGEFTGAGGVLIGGSATVAFSGVTGQVISDVVVEWDFDNDGNFDESVEDITSLVMTCETFAGRDWPSLLTGTAGPGKFKATLNNNDDRFNYFNTSSPLNADPFSLKTGRKLRVRTATATSPDPTLYARDRFGRDDGALGDDENGMTWAQPSPAEFLIVSERAVAQTEGDVHFALIDVGQPDYYAQVGITVLGALSNQVGIIYRYQDTSNYSYMAASATGTIALVDVVADVASTVSSADHEVYSGLTLGVLVSGAAVTGYVEGVAMLSGAAVQTDETEVGLYARWGTGDGAPRLDDFYVWSGLTAEVEGILWTGDASDLQVSVTAGPVKTAELSGEGWLSKMATQRVTPPSSATGRKTGLLIGNILTACNLTNPPGPIDEGDVTTGVYAAEEGDAIGAARDVEEVEFGFLHETNEGPIGFDARSARDGESPAAGFSDAAGFQFGYHEIRPYDQRREVFNRVVAGVSPFTAGVEAVLYTDPGPYVLAPGESQSLIATYDGLVGNWTGHTRDVSVVTSPVQDSVTATDLGVLDTNTVSVTMPATVNANDLLVVVLNAAAVFDDPGTYTSPPAGWTTIGSYNYDSGNGWVVVAAKVAAGTEDGTTVDFIFSDAGSGWGWVARTFRFHDTYTTTAAGAVEVGGFVGVSDDPNPGSITPSWGASPTTFIALAAADGFFSSFAISAYPTSYTGGALTGTSFGGDMWLGTAVRTDSVTTEDPGGFTTSESNIFGVAGGVIAVRGGGTPTVVGTTLPSGALPFFTIEYVDSIGGTTQEHSNIEVSGVPFIEGAATTVRVDDTDSQDDHNAIRTYRNPAELFATGADATTYAELVLDTFSSDRPILSMSFYANKSAAYRNQALRRRVGDMITLVADNNAGLGISQNFFIESIGHRFSHGTTLWEVTWELSPA